MHDLTGSGLAVSALFGTTLVPVMVLAPVAGLVADRFESVRVVVAASLVQALVAAALAVGSDHLGVLLGLSALLAGANAFAQPAEFALIPAVAAAGGRSVTAATGVARGRALRRVRGRAGAGRGVLATLGPEPALLANAATFVAIALAAGAMRARRAPQPRAEREHDRALDGFRIVRGDRVLRVTIAAAVGALLFISASLTVEVFYLKDVVGASDTAYALLLCSWMAGMVVGATALARRVPTRYVAAGALVALGVQGFGMGVQTAWAILPVAFAGYVIGGVAHGLKNVLLRTLLTARVPEALHGRAFAAYNAARNTAELGAVAAGGGLVSALGPRSALLLAGLGAIVAATAGLAVLGRRPRVRRRAPRRARPWRRQGRGRGSPWPSPGAGTTGRSAPVASSPRR